MLLNQKFDSSIPVAEGKILRYPINYKFLMLERKENKHRLQALQIDNAVKNLLVLTRRFVYVTTYIFINRNRNINLGSGKVFLYSFLYPKYQLPEVRSLLFNLYWSPVPRLFLIYDILQQF